VNKELDERTSSDRVLQTRAAAIEKERSPTVDRFDVGTANMSDDHDRSRCLDGRSLMLCIEQGCICQISISIHFYTIERQTGTPEQVRTDTDTREGQSCATEFIIDGYFHAEHKIKH